MNVQESRYDPVDHTADIGYVCRGPSLDRLFENCAVSMSVIMFGDERPIGSDVLESIDLDADSIDLLLVRFLNEILFLWATARLVPGEVSVKRIAGTHISASVRGEQYDPARHEILTEIKAATYHMLSVEQDEQGLAARVIFDV